MSTLKVTFLALAMPLAAVAQAAEAQVASTTIDGAAVTAPTAVQTQTVSTQRTAAGCSQIEQHAGVSPEMCGTYSTAELATMFLALSD